MLHLKLKHSKKSGGNIYNFGIDSFTSNFAMIIRMGAQQNETFKEWYEMQSRDTISLTTNDSKTIIPFYKVGNNQPAKTEQHSDIKKSA